MYRRWPSSGTEALPNLRKDRAGEKCWNAKTSYLSVLGLGDEQLHLGEERIAVEMLRIRFHDPRDPLRGARHLRDQFRVVCLLPALLRATVSARKTSAQRRVNDMPTDRFESFLPVCTEWSQ